MNQATAHPVIERYLRDLERAAQALPRRERRELLAEIRAHLEEGLAASDASDAAVLNLIDGLGEPEAIVASAGPTTPVRGPGVLEVLAVLLLLIGGIVIPVLGWFVGLVLLWASSAWTLQKKLLGTFVFPGGIALPLMMGLMATRVGLQPWAGIPLLIVLVAAPIVVAIVLLRSAERPAR